MIFLFRWLALSVIAYAMPPLPKGEALAFPAKFLVSPEALPLGELLSAAKLRGQGCCPLLFFPVFPRRHAEVCLEGPVEIGESFKPAPGGDGQDGLIRSLQRFGGGEIIFRTPGLLTGELVSLVSYTTQAVNALTMLTWLIMALSRAHASLVRINEVLDETVDITDGPSDAVVEDGSVDFEDVCFSYSGDPDKLALRHITVHINSGETIGIIGGTGEGKSTLVNLIPRFYDTLSGTVRVGGRDVRDYTLEHLRDGVSMVLQNGALFSGTIAQNLRWGNANATQEQLREACAIACADEFIDRFPDGYETVLEQNAANLSGGQKQRLRIARAIVKQPKILILDDSTSAVDMATDEHIRRALKTAMPGSTKIIIAQRIASILSCDRIIVLHEGELSDVGTHAELMERSQIYRDVYDSQMREEGEQHGQS